MIVKKTADLKYVHKGDIEVPRLQTLLIVN